MPAALVVRAQLAGGRRGGRCPRRGAEGGRRRRRAGHGVADVRGAERPTQADAGVLVRRRHDDAIRRTAAAHQAPTASAAAAAGRQ